MVSWIFETANRLAKNALTLCACCGVASFASVQDPKSPESRATPRETPAPLPRDRYSSTKAMTLERFRSVFQGLDLDKNGLLTLKEARAGGMSESDYKQYDLDHNQLVGADQFEWLYAAELRGRGQLFDSDLAKHLDSLDARAKDRKWTLASAKPATKPTAGAGSKAAPNEPPSSLPRNRYVPAESKPAPADGRNAKDPRNPKDTKDPREPKESKEPKHAPPKPLPPNSLPPPPSPSPAHGGGATGSHPSPKK
ncbi:MAG: hypothetical protein HY286_19510 [Planctomycetes bacterium]|nr:hypothetical protein [Planctomycetota bacterium]